MAEQKTVDVGNKTFRSVEKSNEQKHAAIRILSEHIGTLQNELSELRGELQYLEKRVVTKNIFMEEVTKQRIICHEITIIKYSELFKHMASSVEVPDLHF